MYRQLMFHHFLSAHILLLLSAGVLGCKQRSPDSAQLKDLAINPNARAVLMGYGAGSISQDRNNRFYIGECIAEKPISAANCDKGRFYIEPYLRRGELRTFIAQRASALSEEKRILSERRESLASDLTISQQLLQRKQGLQTQIDSTRERLAVSSRALAQIESEITSVSAALSDQVNEELLSRLHDLQRQHVPAREEQQLATTKSEELTGELAAIDDQLVSLSEPGPLRDQLSLINDQLQGLETEIADAIVTNAVADVAIAKITDTETVHLARTNELENKTEQQLTHHI